MTAPLKFKNEYLYPHVIPHWAKFHPKGVAVICDDVSRTWVELERRTCKVANALIAAGVRMTHPASDQSPRSLQARAPQRCEQRRRRGGRV